MNQNHSEIEGDKTEQKAETFFTKVLNKNLYRIIFGIVIGAGVGWLYWEFIGCNGGSCPITNTANKTVILFAAMGGFMARKR
jgi:hypothetical protein